MFKSFIKETTFGITIILFALTVGFIALILPTFGNKALIVRSGSMEPAIKTGDLVIARPATYGVGDIIAFKGIKDESMVITHRITKVTKENGNISYQTKGDANDVEDGFIVPQKNVIGVAQYKISGVGRLFAAAKSRNGLIALVIGPAILLILFEGINLAKEIKKQKNPKKYLMHKIEVYYKGPMGVHKRTLTIKEVSQAIVTVPLLLSKFFGRYSFKTILPIAVSILIINSSFAFFSDTETSTGNFFQAAESFCQTTQGTFWAANVVSSNQGNRKNGTDVLPERSNPLDTLGAPNGIGSPASGFFALGFGGTITVEFDGPVVDVPGVDLSFHEITNGRNTYPVEQANVEVSADGTTWYLIGVATSEPPGDGVVFLDISSNASAPSQINFVKITDTTNASLNPDPLSDGYDVDAIDATALCIQASPLPSPSQSPTPTPSPQGSVVINEVYYDPDSNHIQPPQADEKDFEWVELYNVSGSTVNLKDWKIVDNSGIERTVSTSNRDLTPGQFAILAKAANVFTLWTIPSEAEKIPLGENFGNGLANTDDRVILKDNNGTIVDQMSYGDDVTAFSPAAPDVAEGHSLERNPVGTDTNTAADFVDRNPPTPGT